MSQNLHDASNRAIASMLEKEVTITMTRQDAMNLSMIVMQALNKDWDILDDEQKHVLSHLHYVLNRA